MVSEQWSPALDSFLISGIAVHIISSGKESGNVVIDNIRIKRKEEAVPIRINWKDKVKAFWEQ